MDKTVEEQIHGVLKVFVFAPVCRNTADNIAYEITTCLRGFNLTQGDIKVSVNLMQDTYLIMMLVGDRKYRILLKGGSVPMKEI